MKKKDLNELINMYAVIIDISIIWMNHEHPREILIFSQTPLLDVRNRQRSKLDCPALLL